FKIHTISIIIEMENSPVRTNQQSPQNQAYIMNSPIDSDQEMVDYADYQDILRWDDYKWEHFIINNPPNYQNQAKRRYLNECINLTYWTNGLGHKVPFNPDAPLPSRKELWQQVDTCLKPENLVVRTSLPRVKRKLFHVAKRDRKSSNPKRSQSCGGTRAINFKAMRSQIGRKKIRPGFLSNTRRAILDEIIRANEERQKINTPSVCQRILDAVESMPNITADVIERLTQRAKDMEDMYVTEQIRRTLQSNRIKEESVRSILYAKQLFGL
ncbi:hypothetical protein KR222_002341, partial [Zaprionus bogoriensis]